MESGGGGHEIGGSEENAVFSPGRAKYRPVVAQDNDRAVLEMSSIDLDPPHDLKYIVISLLHLILWAH